MRLLTEIWVNESIHKIDYATPVMMMGSCFTENIGQKLENLKFNTDISPFGILYNPQSIADSLRRLIRCHSFSSDELFFDQGQWNSFMHHSRFSGTNQNDVLQGINNRLIYSSNFLKQARFLILTFGTAWVYQWAKNGKVVSNCHKVPAREFNRYRLSVDEMVSDYQNLLSELKEFNPKIEVVFTVSPVRHWKDGAIENQRSKAALLLAIDELLKKGADNYCSYFPAYEIMMDELRDYRFYAADMLHPNEVAVDYIFEKFSKVMISEESAILSKDVLKILQAAGHRPFNSASEEYRKFLLYNLREIDRLTKNFPFLNLEKEKVHFADQIAGFDQNETM